MALRLLYPVLALALMLSAVIVAPAANAARPRCFGHEATIVGTSGSDELRGTRGRDVIVGRGGRDLIVGRGGNDFICGQGGADEIAGMAGRDRIDGNRGPDVVFGGPHADILRGGAGADVVFGDLGNDKLRGQAGSDLMSGGIGDDSLIDTRGFFQGFFGGPGGDYMKGEFLDTVFFHEAPRGVHVDLVAGEARGDGADRIVGVGSVYGSAFDDTILGTPANNSLTGVGGNDVIDGRGNPASSETEDSTTFSDILSGGMGDDELIGGEGLTFADFSNRRHGVTVDLAAGTATGRGSDTLHSVNGVIGTEFTDQLSGDGSDNVFEGLDGNDSISGAAGNDSVAFWYLPNGVEGVVVDLGWGTADSFETGLDTLSEIESVFGSMGRDTVRGNDGPNRIFGNQRNDDIFGLGGDDYLDGGGGFDRLDGGEGSDICLKVENATACESSTAPSTAWGAPAVFALDSGAQRWRIALFDEVLQGHIGLRDRLRSR